MTQADHAQVLKMVEAGTINASEGARLLGAIRSTTPPPDLFDRWLRIRVTELQTQRPRVTVNLPLSWLTLGLRIGSHFDPDLAQIDVNEIVEAIQSGAEGRLVDVENVEDDERIEIFVD